MSKIEWFDFPVTLHLSNYLISKNGDIFSKNRKKIMTKVIDGDGYACHNLANDREEKKNLRVNRLVALTFISNPDNKPTVDHIDRDRLNNNIDNLKWANHSEQSINQKKKNTANYSRSINQLDMDGNIMRSFSSITEASLFHTGKSTSNIGTAARCGNTCFGFKWAFPEIEDLDGEFWEEIKDHPKYFVSSEGRFISCIKGDERLLFPTEKGGYLNIVIGKENHRAHIWVCLHFNGPKPDENYICNHKNGNRKDNRAVNLEWMTSQENTQHAHKTGLINKANLGVNTRKPVYQYTMKGNFVKKYDCAQDAVISLGHPNGKSFVASCCTGFIKSAYNYIWSYGSLEERTKNISVSKRDKKVYQYNKDGSFVKEYGSAKIAGIQMNGSPNSIRRVCNGVRKTTYGYIWGYQPPTSEE